MSVNLMVRRLKPEEYELNYTEEQTGQESKKIKKDKEYLLIFIDKNRNGPVTQKPLLYEIDYSQQIVIEKGFALMN